MSSKRNVALFVVDPAQCTGLAIEERTALFLDTLAHDADLALQHSHLVSVLSHLLLEHFALREELQDRGLIGESSVDDRVSVLSRGVLFELRKLAVKAQTKTVQH